MTDIVERLRQSVTKGHEPTDDLAIEAADEIELLRTALDRIRLTEKCPRSIEKIALEALLARCLKAVDGGRWRDKAGLSASTHPVWDDVREALTS